MSVSTLFDLTGKTAIVTGGTRGIGEMIAAGFLANGAKVIISSRKADACEETVERLKAKYGGEIYAIPSDVGQMVGIEHLATRHEGLTTATAHTAYGGQRTFACGADESGCHRQGNGFAHHLGIGAV